MDSPDLRVKRVQYLFGTLCSIELSGSSRPVVAEALEAGFAELARIQQRLSPFDPDSELSRLNAAAGRGAWAVSEELCTLLGAALDMSERTQGRYDPTVWPVLELWRSCERKQRFPEAGELAQAVACVDYRRAHLDHVRRTITLEAPTTRLDLSSVIKGYALDRARASICQYPVAAALLDAGGEVLVWRRDGTGMEVGLADPQDRSTILGVLELANQAVATSAQSEAHLMVDGQAIGHLFDPRSGRPLETEVESVSVIAPSGLQADALSTALFMMGPEGGLEFLQSMPDAAAVWVVRRNGGRQLLMSQNVPFEGAYDATGIRHCLAGRV
jgi:thiamine biosynthesis lipoprotein